ncbi:hypothetical protein DFJ63DRAFT_335337 [Scheffersomyces coipomensis]|uniref:uncharacterized protein n=1 Tax=Scheffersomyces coipomensis TaxID=1788519 RepID=UPI00315D74E1
MLLLNQSFKRLSWKSLSNPSTISSSFKTYSPRFISSLPTKPSPSSLSTNLKLLIGCTTGGSILYFTSSPFFKKSILNDSPISYQNNTISISLPHHQKHKTRLNGYLNYEELTIGSIIGLFLGVIIGKLSTILIYLSLSSYLLVEYLQTKQIINIPWNYIIVIGKERIDVKQWLFEKPSFKIAFIASFILTAYNI